MPAVDDVHAPVRGGLDPRLRVLFLLAVAVGVFFLHVVWQAAAACGALAVLWLVVKLPPRRLLRQVLKLWGFALFVLVSYAFFANNPATDRWEQLPIVPVRINVSALVLGCLMILRVIAVILASQVARAGDVRAVAAGLGKLGVPRIVAVSIDTVLSLLGDEPRGRMGRGSGGGTGRGGGGGGGGRGDGGGGGRGRGDGERAHDGDGGGGGFWQAVRRIARGDVEPIVQRLSRQIDRAHEHAEAQSDALTEKERTRVADIGVIAGVSLTMLGIKALKILPSIPFAPGHKLVLLTPLYIVAGMLTRGRGGATLTGLTMGTVAFLMGDGKYGVFEIVKHVVPGIITDLCLPLVAGGGRRPGGVVWTLFGGVIAAGRFATIFVITLLVQAPAVAYAILVPGLTVHITFGLASGYVTFHIVRALDRLPAAAAGRFPPRVDARGGAPPAADAPADDAGGAPLEAGATPAELKETG